MLLLLLACTDAVDTADSVDPCVVEDDSNVLEIEGSADCGEPIYDALCDTCHDDNDVDMAAWVPHHSDIELLLVMDTGADGMPPQQLDNASRAHVLAYLRARYGAHVEN